MFGGSGTSKITGSEASYRVSSCMLIRSLEQDPVIGLAPSMAVRSLEQEPGIGLTQL